MEYQIASLGFVARWYKILGSEPFSFKIHEGAYMTTQTSSIVIKKFFSTLRQHFRVGFQHMKENKRG